MEDMKNRIIKTVYAVFRLLPIRKNTVLLFSYYGGQYSGSPKYIGTYLTENTNQKVFWAFVQPEKYQDVPGKVIRYGHLRYYFNLATAETIITNFRMPEEFHKRREQIYVQTWHGSCPLKKVEQDAEDSLSAGYIKMAKHDARQTDLMLADSRLGEEVFRSSYWYDGMIVKSGLPEYDVFFNTDENIAIKEKVYRYFNIPKDCHIAIYAPTFRRNQRVDIYNLDMKKLADALHGRFGGEWYVFIRLHPHLINICNQLVYDKHVISATEYDDVQELIIASSFIISDYSSVMFAGTMTKTPCMLYTPDFEEYIAGDRGLYIDIDKLPFEHFESQEDLYLAIQKFDNASYEKKILDFLNEIGNYSDGTSSKRAVDAISELRHRKRV